MGNCVSSAQEKAEKARSDAIDRELDEESKRLKKECKILLLGESIQSFSSLFTWALPLVRHHSSCMTIHSYLPHDLVILLNSLVPRLLTRLLHVIGAGESGKSTIVKQMKIIHQNGFTSEELMSYRPTIYRNTVDSAQAIVLAMRKINVDCISAPNKVRLFCLCTHTTE